MGIFVGAIFYGVGNDVSGAQVRHVQGVFVGAGDDASGAHARGREMAWLSPMGRHRVSGTRASMHAWPAGQLHPSAAAL